MESKRVMRHFVWMLPLLLAAGCAGDQKMPTLLGMDAPGLNQFDTITAEDKKEAEWWDNFYGAKAAEE